MDLDLITSQTEVLMPASKDTPIVTFSDALDVAYWMSTITRTSNGVHYDNAVQALSSSDHQSSKLPGESCALHTSTTASEILIAEGDLPELKMGEKAAFNRQISAYERNHTDDRFDVGLVQMLHTKVRCSEERAPEKRRAILVNMENTLEMLSGDTVDEHNEEIARKLGELGAAVSALEKKVKSDESVVRGHVVEEKKGKLARLKDAVKGAVAVNFSGSTDAVTKQPAAIETVEQALRNIRERLKKISKELPDEKIRCNELVAECDKLAYQDGFVSTVLSNKSVSISSSQATYFAKLLERVQFVRSLEEDDAIKLAEVRYALSRSLLLVQYAKFRADQELKIEGKGDSERDILIERSKELGRLCKDTLEEASIEAHRNLDRSESYKQLYTKSIHSSSAAHAAIEKTNQKSCMDHKTKSILKKALQILSCVFIFGFIPLAMGAFKTKTQRSLHSATRGLSIKAGG